LIENHDRARHDVFCYSLFAATDDFTGHIARFATQWRDITSLSTEQAANVIHNDRIDILVDLTGYAGISPMDILACRPAPVQASGLGYLSTSGMTRVDYRITDAFADPPGDSERFHTENLLRLPRSQWCYRPVSDADPEPVPARERNGFVTFGSFNQAAKLSPTSLRLWAEILARVPDSRLLMVGVPPGAATQALLHAFAAHGISAGRITIEPRLPLEDYFLRLRSVDVALDTTPYSGGTTTCDLLWMGTPVVAMRGERSVSRSAAGILSVLGREAWIATSQMDARSRWRGTARRDGDCGRQCGLRPSWTRPASRGTWRRCTGRCGVPGAAHFPNCEFLVKVAPGG
jgi:predicted O-linked N-acetylglucosamine transferase (SPINDLY family)